MMPFFAGLVVGLLAGTTLGFLFAAMARSVSAETAAREEALASPRGPVRVRHGPMNTGRYAVINETPEDELPARETATGTGS